MCRVLLLGLSLFAFACIAHADRKAPAPIPFTMGWHASLDANGHVLRLDPIKNERVDRIPEIRARLEQAIRSWQFLSGTVNGKPAQTETGLWVQAELLPPSADGSNRIRIDHASVGATLAKTTVPHYPGKAIHEGKGGEVVLRVGFDANGKVTSAVLDPQAPKADKLLVDASVAAVRTWTFQPEVVGGHGLAGYAVTPFCYTLNFSATGRRMSKCEWKQPGRQEPIHEGEALAVNPAAHLSTEVAGNIL